MTQLECPICCKRFTRSSDRDEHARAHAESDQEMRRLRAEGLKKPRRDGDEPPVRK